MSRLLALLVALPFLAGGVSAAADRESDVVLTFADPQIVESSGLVARDGLVHTVNDSGERGRVFSVGPGGQTLGVSTWSAEPVDVEALAPAGPGEVWVGDIGDNRAARSSVSVSRVPAGRGVVDAADAPTFELVYADGPRDAETLLADPADGRLYVVSKGFFGGTLYRAPRRLDPDRPNVLEPIADTLAVATDGAFWPDGRHLVIRGYARAVVYAWPSLRAVGELDLPDQDQGEGIAVEESGRLLISTEGQFSDVLAVSLPREVRETIEAPSSATGTAAPEADAGGGLLGGERVTVTGQGELYPVPLWLLLGGGASVIALLGVVGWVVRRR